MKAFLGRQITLPLWAFLLGIVMAVVIGIASVPKDDDTNVSAGTTTTTTTTTAIEETTTTVAAAPMTTAPPTTSPPTTTTTAPTTTAPPPTAVRPTTTAAKRWVKAYEVSGSAEKRTPNFHLTGGETRIRYNSEGGFFAVYVMDSGDSLDESGGFPDVTCLEPCVDETHLDKGEGDYYLEVRASEGTWAVVVEELR